MTDEEAIKNLKKLKSYHNGSYGIAIDMAIKVLEQQQNVHDTCKKCVEFSEFEQQPCEDVISREEALKAMCDKCPMYNCVMGCSSYRHIEKMPSVTPKPRVGEWYRGDPNGNDLFICSVCEATIVPFYNINEYIYCPNCGAKMEGEE